LSSLSRTWEPWPSQFHSSLRRTGTSRTCRPLKAVECSGCRRWGSSTDLSRLLLPARTALTGHDGCYLPKNSFPLDRLRWVAHRSSGFVVAEATSRGARYDKCFAIGKSSRHIFDRRLLSVLRTENNFASLQLFSCIPTENDFKYPATSFRETTTIAPILSGGCELSHGFAVIDLSLEHLERAQDL
jgi:hypothetical protein